MFAPLRMQSVLVDMKLVAASLSYSTRLTCRAQRAILHVTSLGLNTGRVHLGPLPSPLRLVGPEEEEGHVEGDRDSLKDTGHFLLTSSVNPSPKQNQIEIL
jgi:hypothetical protein